MDDAPLTDPAADPAAEPAGWTADAPALLAEIAADNTAEAWPRLRERHAVAVLGPTRALARALAAEFGPVRVFRPLVNRRFRPGAPPMRTDTGGVAASPGGSALAFTLSATELTASAGIWSFDAGQLRRYRAAVAAEPGERLVEALGGLGGVAVDDTNVMARAPRGVPPDHPRVLLLRRRGLQVVRRWPVGAWLAGPEPLRRVRAAWRAAAPLVGWLDEHVGPADPSVPRPRPARTGSAEVDHSPHPGAVDSLAGAGGG